MGKRPTVVLFLFTLIFLSAHGLLYAQAVQNAAVEYQNVSVQLKDVYARMAKASEDGDVKGYDQLKRQYEELKKKEVRLRKILEGDQQSRQKINAVKQTFNDAIDRQRIARYNEALELYDTVIANGKALNNPVLNGLITDAYVNKSQIFLKQKKFEDMKSDLLAANEFSTDNYKVFYFLGIAEEKLMNYQQALVYYQKCSALRKDFVASHYNQGVVYYKIKAFDKAVSKFLDTVSMKPDYKKSFTYLGRSYLESGRPNEAENALQESVRLRPNDWEPYYFLAQVFNGKSSYNEAITSANEGLKLKSGYGGFLIQRGRAYKGLGEKLKALMDFEAALKDRKYRKMAQYEIDNLKR